MVAENERGAFGERTAAAEAPLPVATRPASTTAAQRAMVRKRRTTDDTDCTGCTPRWFGPRQNVVTCAAPQPRPKSACRTDLDQGPNAPSSRMPLGLVRFRPVEPGLRGRVATAPFP